MITARAGDIQNGETVYVYDANSKFLGSAIYNEISHISARVFSLGHEHFDETYIAKAIRKALDQRRALYDLQKDSYRVVFSDADFIPGLIVDKLSDILVVQLLTLASDRRSEAIISELSELLSPTGIVIQRSHMLREKEGLPIEEVEIKGTVTPPVRIVQDDIVLLASPTEGQKTGFYLDQRFNRQLIRPYCQGKRVLDLFSYVGAWGLTAAKAGASEVIIVDSSADAIELARQAAKENGAEEQMKFECSDAFDYATSAAERHEKFDVVVCDPPAFAKSRKHVPDALKAYLSLNYRAMKMLPVGGVLATCSCSQHVSRGDFEEMLETCARNARMNFHVLARGTQAPDHPILLGFSESEYLKCYFLQRVS